MTPKTKKNSPLSDESKTLIRIAAHVDALFWPGREEFQMPREQVRFERRREYLDSGIAVVGSGTVADRQAFGRMLQTLAAAGLLEIFGGTRREGCRLTEDGDAAVRAMINTHTASDGWGLLEVLAGWQNDFGEAGFPEHLPIAEEWEATEYQQNELLAMRQLLLPLLARGYVVARGDGRYPRCYWLKVTPSGLAALDGDPPAGAPPLIEFSQEAADLHDSEFAAYTAELDRADPERPTDLCPPVSCGIGWGSLAAIRKWSLAR